jgi:hypothetical protein
MSASILCAFTALLGGIILGVMPGASAEDTPIPVPPAASANAGGGTGWINVDETVCAEQPASVAKFKLFGKWNGTWNGANDRVKVTNRSTNVLNAVDFTYDPGSYQTIFRGLGSRTRITSVWQCRVDYTVYQTGTGQDTISQYVVNNSEWVIKWSDPSGHRVATIASDFYSVPVTNPDGSWSSTATMGTFVEGRGRGTSVSDCRGYCYGGGL